MSYNYNQIITKFAQIKRKYGSRYSEEFWNYIEENFEYYIDKNTSPCLLMQIYDQIGIKYPDGNFYEAHVNKVKANFDITRSILDIGSGHIPSFAKRLANEQRKLGKGTVTVYEPLLVQRRSTESNLHLHRKEFTETTRIKEFDLLTGILPCEATETMIEKACENQKDFYIALCGCVHANFYYPFMPITQSIYHDYLIDKAERLLNKYDNGTLVVETLGDNYDIDYPILYNRKNIK